MIAVAAAWAGSLHALDPKVPLDEYGLQIWTNDNGLPQNTVFTVLQSSDGYIWAGTSEGLARFAGARFAVFDSRNTPALRSNSCSSEPPWTSVSALSTWKPVRSCGAPSSLEAPSQRQRRTG